MLEEECKGCEGVCEVRESDDNQDEGLITLIGRIISVKNSSTPQPRTQLNSNTLHSEH
ncbi:MAG: hypothetical protein Q8N63_07345 [Nanoarchaeota archaeon]|nr:hypothetical protein [Nanoarchaeota archaeon]